MPLSCNYCALMTCHLKHTGESVIWFCKVEWDFTSIALKVWLTFLLKVSEGISALLDVIVTHSPWRSSEVKRDNDPQSYTWNQKAQRTHLSSLKCRGYFINAHGCSNSNCIYRLNGLELTCCSGTNSTICCLHSAALNNIWQWHSCPCHSRDRNTKTQIALSLISAPFSCTGEKKNKKKILVMRVLGNLTVQMHKMTIIYLP